MSDSSLYNPDGTPVILLPELLPLRACQEAGYQAFVEWYETRDRYSVKTFTAALTPGAGKTRLGLEIAFWMDIYRHMDDFVVLAPDRYILSQWQETFATLNIPFYPDWSNDDGYLDDYDGIGATYQQVASNPVALKRRVNDRTLVIADEPHHLGGQQAWADAFKEATRDVAARLYLTGTPFRSDDLTLPYTKYTDGVLQVNYAYSYNEALTAGQIVRPVQFHALDTDGVYSLNGIFKDASRGFDALYTGEQRRLLNAVLAPDSPYLSDLLGRALQQLQAVQQTTPDAQGMIVCKDIAHAKAIQRMVQQRTKRNPVLCTSDEQDAYQKMADFKTSSFDWLIVVGMGGEGMDNPRLQVEAYLTNILQRLTALQRWHRVTRYRNAGEIAHIFMPAHPTLLQFADEMGDVTVHHLNAPQPEPVPKIPVAEAADSRATEIGSEQVVAGTLIQTGYDMPDLDDEHLLALLGQIQRVAASAVLNYAQSSVASTGDEECLQFAYESIYQVVCQNMPPVPLSTPQRDKRDIVVSLEQQRQENAFSSVLKELQSAYDKYDWYRDVLAYLAYCGGLDEDHDNGDAGGWVDVEQLLQAVPEALSSHFKFNYDRNLLLKIGLFERHASNGVIRWRACLTEWINARFDLLDEDVLYAQVLNTEQATVFQMLP